MVISSMALIVSHCRFCLGGGRTEAQGVQRLRDSALGFPITFQEEQSGFGEAPGAHAALAFLPASEPRVHPGIRVICQAWKHFPTQALGLLG